MTTGAVNGKKTSWQKKFLLPLCVLTLTLIVCVYIPSNTRVTIFTQPKAIPRPVTAAVPSQQTTSVLDGGAVVRSLDSTYSTNGTSYPTVPNRALSKSDQNQNVQTSTLTNEKSRTAQFESAGDSRQYQNTADENAITSKVTKGNTGQLFQEPPQTHNTSVNEDNESNHQNVNEAVDKDVKVSKQLNASTTQNKGKKVSSSVILSTGKITDTKNIDSDEKCSPTTKIVFIKTHKTGSTTMASIFERFGYRKKLMFALPKRGHVFSNDMYFSRHSVIPIPKALAKSHPRFDILDNHARYKRTELDLVVPNAKYITILRDPVQQLESAFGYFEMAKGMGIFKHSNPFEVFMQNPYFYYTRKNYTMKTRSRNGQLFDLGFDPKFFNNTDAIIAKIHALSKEFELVLITEYFDESLILMKKTLCWSFDDILYVSNGIRSKSHRFSISETLKEKIRRWNAGDVLLYNHFNRTFWEKINAYGPNFEADLKEFRRLENEAMDRCVDSRKVDKHDRREDKFVLNRKHPGIFCQDLLRGDVPYTSLLRNKMKESSSRAVDKANHHLMEHRKTTNKKKSKKS